MKVIVKTSTGEFVKQYEKELVLTGEVNEAFDFTELDASSANPVSDEVAASLTISEGEQFEVTRPE